MTDEASDVPANGEPRRRKQVPWKGRPAGPSAAGEGADGHNAAAPAAGEAVQVAAVRAQNRATEDQAMRDRGRKIGGVGGAALAGMMVAMRDIYERAPQDQGAVVVDSPSEPLDAHRDGMKFGAGDVEGDADLAIEAQDRRDPVERPASRPSRVRRILRKRR